MFKKLLPLIIIALVCTVQTAFAQGEPSSESGFYQPVFQQMYVPDTYAGADYEIIIGDEMVNILALKGGYSFNKNFGIDARLPYKRFPGIDGFERSIGTIDIAARGAFYLSNNLALGYGSSVLMIVDKEEYYQESIYLAPYFDAVYKMKGYQFGVFTSYETAPAAISDQQSIGYGSHAMAKIWNTLHLIGEVEGKTVITDDETESFFDLGTGFRFTGNKTDKLSIEIGAKLPLNHEQYDFQNTLSMVYTF